MSTITQKTTALTFASIFTLALFTLIEIDQPSNHINQATETNSHIQQVTIVGQRMTAKQKIAFDAKKSGNFS